MAGPLTGDRYEIIIGAALDHSWAEGFGGFEVRAQGETTKLTGTIADQAALHGVLARLRDLAIPILTVHRLPSETTPPG